MPPDAPVGQIKSKCFQPLEREPSLQCVEAPSRSVSHAWYSEGMRINPDIIPMPKAK